MGARGPKPTPTALRVLQGNRSKRALPQNEPKPQRGLPSPPHYLDAYALEEWERLAQNLHVADGRARIRLHDPSLVMVVGETFVGGNKSRADDRALLQHRRDITAIGNSTGRQNRDAHGGTDHLRDQIASALTPRTWPPASIPCAMMICAPACLASIASCTSLDLQTTRCGASQACDG